MKIMEILEQEIDGNNFNRIDKINLLKGQTTRINIPKNVNNALLVDKYRILKFKESTHCIEITPERNDFQNCHLVFITDENKKVKIEFKLSGNMTSPPNGSFTSEWGIEFGRLEL